MAIYCEYEGINGNVTAEGYEGQIDVSSFNFSVGRGISMETGNCSNREATRPSLSEISITKELDNASPNLFKESVATASGKKVLFHFIRTADDGMEEYMTYELEDTVVSGYSISAAGGDGPLPMESVTLSYSKLMVSHTQYDQTNKAGSPVRCGYDVAKGKKC